MNGGSGGGSSETERLFARFFVEENQSECFRILDEIGKHPLTERSIRSLSNKLLSSLNSNIRKKIVCFLGDRLRKTPYTCEIISLLRRVVDCDESAPVRSIAIEYLQTLEQKRSFSSVSSLSRSVSPSHKDSPSSGSYRESPGYESDNVAIETASTPSHSPASSSTSPLKLTPPAKKRGKLASLFSQLEKDETLRKEKEEEEISQMNKILEKRAKEEAERKAKKEEEKRKQQQEQQQKKEEPKKAMSTLINITENFKYTENDKDDISNTPLPNLPRKAKESQLNITMINKTLSTFNSSQKSASLPICIGEQTIHTKRAIQHPILSNNNSNSSSSFGGILHGGSNGGGTLHNSFLSKHQNKQKMTSYDVEDLLPLSEEQKAIVKFALTKQSFFFTGAAGTGKSFVLKRLVKTMKHFYGDENVFVTASTGMAACNIGGITLHSFAGIGLGQKPVKELVDYIKKSPAHKKRWRKTHCLIVDEISMISGELFDKLECIARIIRNKPLPFGGIQVILCGDFFQLPPVFDGTEKKYCFEADSWNMVIKKNMELKTVFRQKDQSFIQLLNEVRIGQISQSSWNKLRECCTRELPNDGVEPTRLCIIKYNL